MERKINEIIDGALAYAIFRLPFSDECCIVAQTDGEIETFDKCTDLNGRRGFVMIPFAPADDMPIVLIRPDVEYHVQVPCADESATTDLQKTEQVGPTCSDDYAQAFNHFHKALKEGYFTKLVLSRNVKRHVKSTDMIKTFLQTCISYPRMMVYLCHLPDGEHWIGCTPEILLSGRKSHYRTMALAGTMPLSDSKRADMVTWSEKNKKEQQIVADYIRDCISPFASVIEEEGPYSSRAGQLLHLKTDFHFTPSWLRKEKNTSDRLCELIDRLHPTPAVCGLPKAEAQKFIIANEGYGGRRYYSGVTGMLNPDGQTDLYVNLRCASIRGDEATLYAGGGILTSSTMEAEWMETEEKLKTIGNVLH